MATSRPSHAIRGFKEIDGLDQAQVFLIHFLDLLDTFDAIRAYRTYTIDLLKVAESRVCLDVGSGTGTFAIDLSRALGSEGRVTGIDLSQTMVRVARQRNAEQQAGATFKTADALDLPFDDDHFDAARAERVFMYLDDLERAAAELLRVTRPGGLVIVSDADLESAYWDVAGLDPTVLRRFKATAADGIPNGQVGSALPRLMKRAGLQDVAMRTDVVVVTDSGVALDGMGHRQFIEQLVESGVLTADEAAECIALAEAAGAAGDYLAGYTYFTVWGRVP